MSTVATQRDNYPQKPNPLLNIEDLAERLGTTVDALYMGRYRGDMPGVLGFKVGRRLKFDADEVEAYIEAQKAATQPVRLVTFDTASATGFATSEDLAPWRKVDEGRHEDRAGS